MPAEIADDFFVSYASADNRTGWVDAVVAALIAEHERLFHRKLTYFIDRQKIQNLARWHVEIFNKGLVRSRFLLAFLSPAYLASEVCRREWKAWIDQEISLHILGAGSAPIYCVEVPGFLSKPMLSAREVAAEVASLCPVDQPLDRFAADLAPIVTELRRRQICNLVPYHDQGGQALQLGDAHQTLERLARHIHERTDEARRAEASLSRVPAYNKKFAGRLDELVALRTLLTNNRAGVIAGIHGLGGIGKTELAYTFAHAYASVYPGGRFEVACEYRSTLPEAVTLSLGNVPEIRERISDEERRQPSTHFDAIRRVLSERLQSLGAILLVLDNVTDLDLISAGQTDALTILGPALHLLATTRLATGAREGWLTLGELSTEDALALMEKHRPFSDDAERSAGETIAQKLGGFALAIELIAAGLALKTSATYASIETDLGLGDLDILAEDGNVQLRRHNHEKRLAAVLTPTLADLSPEARLTLNVAALLHPDYVPLPWLRELVVAEFPALGTSGRWGDPWREVCSLLIRAGLVTPVEEEAAEPRLVRMHRLVQALIVRGMPRSEFSQLQRSITKLVEHRLAVLNTTSHWQEAAWEVIPLAQLAGMWDDLGHPSAGTLMNATAMHLYHLGDWSNSESLMRRALELAEESGDAEEVALYLNNLGQVLHDAGRYSEAEPLMRQVLAMAGTSVTPAPTEYAKWLVNLARLLNATGRNQEAEPLLLEGLEIDRKHLGPDHPSVARDLNNLARVYQKTDRLAESEPLMRRALAIDEAHYGLEHHEIAVRLGNLASAILRDGPTQEGEDLLRRALNIYETCYGPDHTSVALALNNLGNFLVNSGRHEEAEPLLLRAKAIDENASRENHHEFAAILSNLARVMKAKERLGEAEGYLRQAQQLVVQALGPRHPDVIDASMALARFLMEQNRTQDAFPLIRQAMEATEQTLGPEHPSLIQQMLFIGRTLRANQEYAEAEPLLRRALALAEQIHGPDHHQVSLCLHSLARLLLDTSRPHDAEELLDRTLAIDRQTLGSENPEVALCLATLAELYLDTNRLWETRRLMKEAVVILFRDRCRTGKDHPHLEATVSFFRNLLERMGASPRKIQKILTEAEAEARQTV